MREINFKKSGLTILEVILATTLFSILAGLVFHIYVVSAQSWLKVRQTVEVRESAQIIVTRIQSELRGSSIGSVKIIEYPSSSGNYALSFLSAYDRSTGRPLLKPIGKMNWQKYVIFYIEDDPRVVKNGYYQLWSREVDLGEFKGDYPTQSIEDLAYPPVISPAGSAMTFDLYISLATDLYISEPRPVAKNITHLSFIKADPRVEIRVKTGKLVNPLDSSSEASPEKTDIRGMVVLRNL